MMTDAGVPAPILADENSRSRFLKDTAWPWIRGLFVGQRPHPESRYREPGTLVKGYLYLFPRTSRIYLYEAQERHIHLSSILEHHKRSRVGTAQELECAMDVAECERKLNELEVLLHPRQHSLNFLWREMTRVYIRLFEKVIAEDALLAHLDLAREEAYKLGLNKDPEVAEMLRRLAEEMDENEPTKARVRRQFRVLLERFNTIRTGRMHQQYVNVRTYRLALALLVPLGMILLTNPDLVIGASPVQMAWLGPLQPLFEWIHRFLATNVLAFVFVSGLAGGYLSVATKLRDRELTPGDDVYFSQYVLTRPFIGAIGAVILCALFLADLVSSPFLEGLSEQLQARKPGPTVFGFGFFAGFTERLVFPSLGGVAPKK